MALSCASLFAPVDIRRCSPRPPRQVFFHHGHLIERRRVSLSRTGYLAVSASHIRNAQAGIHPSSTEEKDPPSARIFIKGFLYPGLDISLYPLRTSVMLRQVSIPLPPRKRILLQQGSSSKACPTPHLKGTCQSYFHNSEKLAK
ncbi:hypothetical protein HPP92_011529 [Vanilla planifolia]|uniref:Uncharacterized protein n=1 Tax=Vanilla planifolia TaxID=51239 RepID=A0A835V4I0_VANPL|nr:hypothetical protein HPP92_011529 [Vanilla planifolia]